jgi:hypothetical protein
MIVGGGGGEQQVEKKKQYNFFAQHIINLCFQLLYSLINIHNLIMKLVGTWKNKEQEA